MILEVRHVKFEISSDVRLHSMQVMNLQVEKLLVQQSLQSFLDEFQVMSVSQMVVVKSLPLLLVDCFRSLTFNNIQTC